METMMTDLEIVLLIAFVFMYWMYRKAHRAMCKYKSALVAVGLGHATVHVNEQSKRFKVEMHTND
jgi:preprotein translocase subunit YajC